MSIGSSIRNTKKNARRRLEADMSETAAALRKIAKIIGRGRPLNLDLAGHARHDQATAKALRGLADFLDFSRRGGKR